MTKKFETEELVKPPFWGGWRVVPHSIEFWVEGEFRIHKRVQFKRDNLLKNEWKKVLLSP